MIFRYLHLIFEELLLFKGAISIGQSLRLQLIFYVCNCKLKFKTWQEFL